MPYLSPEAMQQHAENVRKQNGGGSTVSNLGPMTKGVPPGPRGINDKTAANAFPIYGPKKNTR